MPVDQRILQLERSRRAGDPVRTLAACRALRADLTDDVALAAWADVIEAAALCDDDDTRKARPLAERAAIEARRHGVPAMVAVSARVLGEILLAQGDRVGAQQRLAWAGEALGDRAAADGPAQALRWADLDAALAQLAHQRGAPLEAEAHAANAIAAYDRAGEGRAAAVVLLLGAEIRDLGGDPVGASRILDAVERRLSDRDEVLRGALDLARASHALAESPDRAGGERALAHAHRGLDRIVVGAGPGLPADRSKGRARVAQARGWLCVARANQALDDFAGARVAFERAAALFEAAGRPPDPAQIGIVDLLLRRRAFGDAREVLDAWLGGTDPDADPARLALIHTLFLPCAAELRDFTAFDRHLRRLAAAPGPTSLVAARAARLAGVACGAIEDGGAGSRSRAARAHAVARAAFAALGLPDEVAVEDASLAALGARAAPVPAGPFDLVRRIGLGATGEVWRGRHHDLRWPVAVKVLALPHDDPRYRALIADEIRAVAALDHPNVVRVVGTGAIGPEAERMTRGAIRAGAPWFAMELADAGTLAEVCGALSWRLCRSVLLSLLDALAHAHARGVVHLDLKPANVLLRTLPDGQRSVLLTDFGLAGIARAAWSTEIAGTPHYMAPEQFTGDRRDFGPWTDLYALGCLAVDLVTGAPPFPGESLAEQRAGHLEAPIPRLRPRMACPSELRAWVERLLAKAPAARFQRAADAARQLAQLPTEPPIDAEAEPEGPEPFQVALSLASVRANVPPDPRRGWGTAPPVADVPPDWRPGAAPVGLDVDLTAAALDLFALRHPPLVGRNAERDQLWACLDRASARGTPVVVGIEGPRGCGKTALARWLCERGHELGAATALDGGPGPDGLHGLRAMVARHLRVDGLDRDARFARILRGVPDLPRAVLEDLAALTGDEDPGEASTGERVGAVAAFVASIAAQRPVVIRIEPVGEPHPEELLLVRVLGGVPAPVVVLCEIVDLDADVDDEDLEPTADGDRPLNRPEAGWRLASAHHVRIGPMRDEDVGALLDALVPLRPSLRARIVEIAGGNPELAVQLVADRIAADALVAADGAYELRPGARLALPQAVAVRYAERIATVLPGLTTAERNVVCAAALLGAGALAQRWTALCEAADVDEELLFARLEGLVRPNARRGPRFEHPALPLLLREAWADLAAAELAVAALEAAGAPPAVLGPLMLRAGRIRECAEPLYAGAEAASAAGDLDRASELLDRRAEVLGALGLRLTARDALLRAQIACAAGRPFAEVTEAAEAIAAADGDRGASARAWVLRAIAAHDAGDTALGRERAERAVAVFRDLADREGAAEAWCVAGDVARTAGDLASAADSYRSALAALGPGADGPSLGPSLGPAGLERASAARIGLARVALARGEVEAAREALDRLAADLAALGTSISAWCLSDLSCARGDVARHASEVPEAEGHYRSALARAPYHLVRRLRAIQLRRILLRLVAGRATEAGGALDALLVRDGRVGAGDHSPFAALCRLVELALAVRRDERTWSLALARARALAARVHDPDAAWLLDVTGRRAHDAGRRDRAQIAWTLAVAVYRTLGRDADLSRIEAALAALDRRPPPIADAGP